jgi:hypothetical protein
VNAQGAQIAIASFTDAVQVGSPARGMLPRLQPRGQLAAMPERSRVPYCSNQGTGGHRPNPRSLLELATLHMTLMPVGKLPRQLGDLSVQFFDVRQQPSKEITQGI